jgi:tetratricopeptide (TPR) repeat protein
MAKVPGRRPASFGSILAVLEQVARKQLGQSIDRVGPTVTIDEPDRLLNLSSLHHQLGNGAKSRAYAEQALRLEPRSAPGRLALGNALNILEDRHGAIASFEKALSFDPDDHTERASLGNLALSSFLAGDEQAGCHWLQRAIELAQSRGRVGELDSLSNFFAKNGARAAPSLSTPSMPRLGQTWRTRCSSWIGSMRPVRRLPAPSTSTPRRQAPTPRS